MFQLFIDHSDINTLTALYMSLYLGLVLKNLWALGVDSSSIGSLSNPYGSKIIHPLFFYKKKSSLTVSIILIRIVKFIRRKACFRDDDSEKPISFLFSTLY